MNCQMEAGQRQQGWVQVWLLGPTFSLPALEDAKAALEATALLSGAPLPGRDMAPAAGPRCPSQLFTQEVALRAVGAPLTASPLPLGLLQVGGKSALLRHREGDLPLQQRQPAAEHHRHGHI